jgi:thioredoxin-related protein
MKNRYSRDFIIVESKPPQQYSEDHELRKLTKARYTPNFVFLDYRGKRVLQTRGFNNEHEAKTIHEFVSSRAYKTAKFADYTATRPMN